MFLSRQALKLLCDCRFYLRTAKLGVNLEQPLIQLGHLIFSDPFCQEQAAADKVRENSHLPASCILKVKNIVRPAFDFFNSGKDRATGTRFRIFQQDIIEFIAKNRLGAALEVGNNRIKTPVIQVFFLHIDNVFIEVQMALRTGAGQKAFCRLIDLINLSQPSFV